ncbi:hypothetical protein H6F75_24920 [Nodosilinea sp. FACHB-131]|uniref:hypothetical protein n=1 Tax=Cyanophyceae TaxID=3028117 RepID=UPI001684A908|nr:hypothetical protein [Nodosilinea sp. FACHB-131]MBD1876735.1 hypothetical protein [Nodosilinea sp. FACHB-131]
MAYTLTKANILAGIQCHKRLWHEVNRPSTAPQISPDQQRIIDQGQESEYTPVSNFPTDY